jgi:hypothetical protein
MKMEGLTWLVPREGEEQKLMCVACCFYAWEEEEWMEVTDSL